MNIRFLTLAQKEVDEAVLWFDENANGKGRNFWMNSIAPFTW